MTFTTNKVTECILTKELWRKVRIWLNIISSTLCHPDRSDFPIVENACAAFVQTSTLDSIENFYTKIKAFSELVSRVNSKGRKYLKYKPKEENICFQTICEKGFKKLERQNYLNASYRRDQNLLYCSCVIWKEPYGGINVGVGGTV